MAHDSEGTIGRRKTQAPGLPGLPRENTQVRRRKTQALERVVHAVYDAFTLHLAERVHWVCSTFI